MTDIYPILNVTSDSPTAAELPLYRDIAWDMDADMPRFDRHGEPVIAEGLEALTGWALNAIRTERYRWEMFDFAYGCKLMRLVGQPYSPDTKLAEATRYITEALLVNPYITGVRVSGATFAGSTFEADVTIETAYGEGKIHV